MSIYEYRFPKSQSKSLAKAVEIAKRVTKLEEEDDFYRLKPSYDELLSTNFRKLLDVSGRWKGAEFFEDGHPCTLKEFERIGFRIGDPVRAKAPPDWIESRCWYRWGRPQDLVTITEYMSVLEIIPPCDGAATYPVEIVFTKGSDRDSQTIEALVDGELMGHLLASHSDVLLAKVKTLTPIRCPGVVVRSARLFELFVWPDWPISSGVRIQDVDREERAPWWTDDVALTHDYALWKIKFPDRKEPVNRFDERIRADLEGRVLEPRQRKKRQGDSVKPTVEPEALAVDSVAIKDRSDDDDNVPGVVGFQDFIALVSAALLMMVAVVWLVSTFV